MTRRETHYDAMLKHLGATYYQTLQGQASPSDVARAVDSLRQEAARGQDTSPKAKPSRRAARTGRWRVRDVMTTAALTVDRQTPGGTLAKLMSEQHTSAVPVLAGGRRVAGVVSEADLLRTQHRRGGAGRRLPGRPGGAGWRLPGRRRGAGRPGNFTAAELMTAPAITIHPDAPLAAAARRMTGHHLTMLPVVGAGGELIGVVSRRDLLKVFLRPDADIAEEVRQVLADVLLLDPAAITVSAHDGLVTLTGQAGRAEMAPIAARLAGEVDGVLAVADNLSAAAAVAGREGG